METDHEGMLAELLDYDPEDPELRRLTDWEVEFITSVSQQFEEKRVFSPKQGNIIEKIWGETFGDKKK